MYRLSRVSSDTLAPFCITLAIGRGNVYYAVTCPHNPTILTKDNNYQDVILPYGK